MTVTRFSVAGHDISIDELAAALRLHFPNKLVRVEKTGDFPPIESNEIFVGLSRSERLEAVIERKDKALKELEATSAKALQSIQTFHKQQQALFDEFVLLRQRYDEQKQSLLTILWVNCSQFHPELKHIPLCQDENFLETDERIGMYGVGDFLGEGQFATVRMCWKLDANGDMLHSDELYALKTIKKEKITSLQSLKRVSNEIDILKRLKSKFVVAIHDVMHSPSMLYMVTEKGGADMFEFFDEHPEGVSEAWAKEIITCVLRGVNYCHEQGVCHRDLKPENILLVFDQQTGKCKDLKLCDFGLSTKFQSKIPLFDFCGSPGFFAPEMITYGKYYGDKADIWSTGCILLELILGHERFCDLWMTAYDYEVMQDKERFSQEIVNSVTRLPNDLTFSANQNDFILRILKLRSTDRPLARQVCVHPWLDGAFDDELSPSSSLDPSTPKAVSTRLDMLSPSVGNLSSPALAANNLAIKDMVISQRERHMLEVDTEKTGHQLTLPPIEPQTPSIGRARKFLNSELSGKKLVPDSLGAVGPLMKSTSEPAVSPRRKAEAVDAVDVSASSCQPNHQHVTPEQSRKRLSSLQSVNENATETFHSSRSGTDEELSAISQGHHK